MTSMHWSGTGIAPDVGMIRRRLLLLLVAGAFLVPSAGAEAAGRGPTAKPKRQATAAKPARVAQPAKNGSRLGAKVPKAAQVSFKADFKGERLSDAKIVDAVRSGFADYLREPKGGMSMTRGEWNRMEPQSVRVKSVTIEKDTSSHLGWPLEKGERMFTAVVEVKQIENGKPRITTAQVRSVIVLSPRVPRFGVRVKGTPELKAEDMRHLGNPSTVGWID